MKQYMLSKVLLSVSIVTESVVAPIVVSNANQIHAADKQDGISNLTQKNKSVLHLSITDSNITGKINDNEILTLSDGKTTKQIGINVL
ncbi:MULTISPECIES: hypothetical protein [Staphylococcus]|jgi:hypothetical protein|uniref:hypothetical protein n=1 Tax=Staphylococcus TaxID=1279 RepID=UPI00066186CF|nr:MULTISPECIES: hypothetical protein [Staphylococcus]OFK83255.1 hypothetical protein HMPREF2799_01660 [Staphylococcus sp. HMSC057A02]OFN15508.1 hypothetical protein HMPREF2612_05630 [Staphylococcus sp. HMSC058D09]KPG89297.1 hypothetical protein AEQ58_06645 [Staphylococcus hominis]MCI2840788.1 hypothetical protein [Staphylococcus hominis]MCI2880163.1 hypothetical protein [Staphylococcus hominis]